MDYDKILRKYRKKPIADPEDLKSRELFKSTNIAQQDIKRIIPHRDPFLLVDRITGIDLTENEETIFGERYISGNDPVFQGHFPDFPVYPGALQIEMGGQLGLCLTHFFTQKTYQIDASAVPVNVRATRVLGAYFLEPVSPDTTVTVIARKLEFDGYFGTVLSQILNGQTPTCVSIAEVIFVD